jgi:hypothetical protein
MMVLIFVLQIVSLVLSPTEKRTAGTLKLLGDTLEMQAITQHELIKRLHELEHQMRELERRVNARKLPEAKREQDSV